MYRLLNGDVGSGKTVVAAAAAMITAKAGHSTIIMAPTTILAQQHYESLSKLLNDFDVKTQLLTAGMELEPTLKSQVIIGTHALLFNKHLPENIALVIVDEQHRFGVSQREKLLAESQEGTRPHYLTMTATPIPRTLTNVIYGDMEVSVIKEMPKHRIPIKSHFVPNSKRGDCFKWVLKQIISSEKTEQAFIVFPLIDESDNSESKAATAEFEKLSKTAFKDLKVGLLHGRMKDDDKNQILEDFKNKKYNVLFSTTVIEVGIDIPDATIIVIEDADRFGLAQLHQLRGRVGRGKLKSYCFVLASAQIDENLKAQERLDYFCQNNSGFDVADYDLKARGPGEVYGVKQSGFQSLKLLR